MKRVVVTIAIDGLQAVHALTGPRLAEYASQLDAEFIVLQSTRYALPHFAKFEMFELVASRGYDQMLYVDADIYIRKHAPSIFEQYTSAMFSELPHPKPEWLQKSIDWIRQNMDKAWPGDRYFNTGVIVADRTAVEKLASIVPSVAPHPGVFFEQEQLNLIMRDIGFPDKPLEPRWNQFCCPTWITPQLASEAYFLHATGAPVEDKITLLNTFMRGYP